MHEICWSMSYLLQLLSLLVVSGSLDSLSTQAFTEYEFDLPLYQQSIPWLVCHNGWIQLGVNCIKVFPEKASFDEAEIVCKSYGGQLIDIEGVNLNRAVGEEAARLTTADAVWIGFKRYKNSTYQWTNRKAATVFDGIWLLGQPKVYKKDLDLCVSMVTSGDEKFRWKLEYCDVGLSFVCVSVSCGVGDFRCGCGGCVADSLRCDGQADCEDGSDELDCTTRVSCGGTLRPPNYTFQTPRRGGLYQPWLKCTWKLQAPIGQKVQLQFLAFLTEDHHDIVTVRDGPLVSDRVITRLSGSHIPDVITSSTNFLLVTFTSDHSVERLGFIAEWHTVTSLSNRQLTANNKVEWITSLEYPDCVEANSVCSWLISSNDLVSIQIVELIVLEDEWLEVRDGESGQATLLAQYSRGDSLGITSTGCNMYLKLKTGLGHAPRALNITYHSGCDVTMSIGYGRITSPGYAAGNQYPNNLQCTWTLQDLQQRELTLVFHQFDIEAVADSMLVYNSTNISKETLVAIIHGQKGRDESVRSSSGQLVIHFHSDEALAKAGWTASFSFGCHDDTSPSPHLARTSSDATYTSSISYSCDTGYRMIGTQERFCDIGGLWRTSPPTCKLIHCGPPRLLKNGALLNITSRDYDGVAYYVCNPGHQIVGNYKVTCLDHGWSDLPDCKVLVCPKLKALIRGRISTPIKYYIFSRAEFRCEAGYRLVGYMYSECRNGSGWSHPMPECVPAQEIKCPEVIVTHGTADKLGPIRAGDSVHVTCESGYQLSIGDGILNCTDTGYYDKSLPICDDIDECEETKDLCGSQHACINTVGSYWCDCADGYQHSSSSGQNCTDIDECADNEADCDETCENTDGGFTCTCQEGHRLYQGNQIVVIGSKVLVPRRSCYVLCPALYIEDAARLVYSTEPAPDGSYISPTHLWIHCPYGSVLDGPSLVQCQLSGSWSADVSKCTPELCPELPVLANGTTLYENNRRAGTFVEFHCNQGYHLHGNQNRYCQHVAGSQSQYEWTGSQPSCKAVDCGAPPGLSYGTVSSVSRTSYTSEAVYTCLTGYTMMYNDRRTCLSSGRWSDEVIVCVEETCPNPDIPMHGSVSSGGNSVFYLGSLVSFTCDTPGYQITDSKPLECVPADWTEEVVTTSAPVHIISVVVTIRGLAAHLETCSSHYSSQLQSELEKFVINVKHVCDMVHLLDVTVADVGTAVDSSHDSILVKKTVQISPQAGELTVAVSQPCVDDIWQQLKEGSSGTSGVKLAASQHCPQATVQGSDINLQEPAEVCQSGSLIMGDTVNMCLKINKGPIHSSQLDFNLVNGSSLGQSDFDGVRTVISVALEAMLASLELPALCPQTPDIQLVNTAGTIVINNSQISVGVPFFLYDHSASFSDVQTCAALMKENLGEVFPVAMNGALDDSDISGPAGVALSLDQQSVHVSDRLKSCPGSYIFHDESGGCVFCPACFTKATSTVVTTIMEETTTTTTLTTIWSVPSSTTSTISYTTTDLPDTRPVSTTQPGTEVSTLETTAIPTEYPSTTSTTVSITTSDTSTVPPSTSSSTAPTFTTPKTSTTTTTLLPATSMSTTPKTTSTTTTTLPSTTDSTTTLLHTTTSTTTLPSTTNSTTTVPPTATSTTTVPPTATSTTTLPSTTTTTTTLPPTTASTTTLPPTTTSTTTLPPTTTSTTTLPPTTTTTLPPTTTTILPPTTTTTLPPTTTSATTLPPTTTSTKAHPPTTTSTTTRPPTTTSTTPETTTIITTSTTTLPPTTTSTTTLPPTTTSTTTLLPTTATTLLPTTKTTKTPPHTTTKSTTLEATTTKTSSTTTLPLTTTTTATKTTTTPTTTSPTSTSTSTPLTSTSTTDVTTISSAPSTTTTAPAATTSTATMMTTTISKDIDCGVDEESSDSVITADFNYTFKQYLLLYKVSFFTSTANSFCVENYRQQLEALLQLRAMEFRQLKSVYSSCTSQGAFVQFQLMNLEPNSEKTKVDMILIVSITAMLDHPVSELTIQPCLETVSQHPHMSFAFCLLRNKTVAASSRDCLHLSTDEERMLLYNMLHECVSGWNWDTQQQSCIQDATSSTSTTTTPSPTPVTSLTCFSCNKGSNNEECTETFESCNRYNFDKPVCQTEVRYQKGALSYMSKGCEESTSCERRMNSTSRNCSPENKSATCYYCCDSPNCNQHVQLLVFKKGRRRRAVAGPRSTRLKWSTNVPQCVDTEPPVFKDCPVVPIEVTNRLLPLVVNVTLPSVTDNSGNQPKVSLDFPLDDVMATGQATVNVLVFESMTLTVTATDATGNHANCLVHINVLDEVAPQLVCPTGLVTLTAPSSSQYTPLDYSALKLLDPSDAISVSYSPEPGQMVQLLQEISVTVTAYDAVSNKAECQFTLIIEPAGCPTWSLQTPAYAELACKEKKDVDVCSVRCWKNASAIVEQQEFTCRTQGQWQPHSFVPDCMPNEYMECPVWQYSVQWTLVPEAKVGVDNAQCNFTSSVAEAIKNLLPEVTNVSVHTSIHSGKIYMKSTFTVVTDTVQLSSSQLGCPGVLTLEQLDGLTVTNGCKERAQLINATMTNNIQKTCPPAMVLIENDEESGVCWPCPVGSEARTASCQPCQTGSYRDNILSSACLLCPHGTATKGPYSSSQSDCRDLCSEGEYSITGVVPCNKCGYAQYQSHVGSTSCLNCQKGTNTTGMGAKSSDSCLLLCAPGEYSPTGMAPCSPCPYDTFSDTDAATTCIRCPQSTMTTNQGTGHREDCHEPIDYCASVVCQGNSQCVNNKRAGHSCVCNPGYTGVDCKSRTDPCEDNLCVQGRCISSSLNSYTCQCKQGYTGSHCEEVLDPCLSAPCLYGHCVRDYTDNTHSCSCYDGFTGDSCSENINDCIDHVCENGGQCKDLVNSYECDCKDTGFRGKYCEAALDVCENRSCLNGGLCTELDGKVICACAAGYMGSYCETEMDACESSPCKNGGQCSVQENGDGFCICKAGSSGSECEIDNTSCEASPCGLHGKCLYLDSQYVCSCHEGYTGSRCEHRTDHCTNHPCNMHHTIECVNTVPGFTCICHPGWTGDTCDEQVDQCSPTPCYNDGTCAAFNTHYNCSCIDGFVGDRCQENVDDCEWQPCVNGGICEDSVASFSCHCQPGFTGHTCEVELDLCEAQPCGTGATCVDNMEGYVCLCGPDWTGQNCTDRVNPCLSLPCLNGGTCGYDSEGYTCYCLKDFNGYNCEVEVNACEPNPCNNGATCVITEDNFKCMCQSGFNGNKCETADTCVCQNGGTCVYSENKVTCQCPIKYKGPTCDKEKSTSFDLTMLAASSEPCVVVTDAHLKVNHVSVCLWLRVTVATETGAFILLTDSRQVLVEIRGDIVTVAGSNVLLGISDRGWHHLCLTLAVDSPQWTVSVDKLQPYVGTSSFTSTSLSRLKVEVGLTEDRSYSPVDIHGLNIYSSIVSAERVEPDSCSSGDEPGDLASWIDFEVCGGVVGDIIAPSACHTHTSQCAPGFRGAHCTTEIDKHVPVVEFCPKFVHQSIYEEEFSSVVMWQSPSFTDDVGIVDIRQTHKSGQTLAFGEHWVVFTAFDAELNHVTCSFPVFVTPMDCNQPDPPDNGVVTCDSRGNSRTVCTISCLDPSLYQFTGLVPSFYNCGQDRLWDPPLGKRGMYPPCARFSMPSEVFKVDVLLTGPACSEAHMASLSTSTLAKLAQTRVCSMLHCDKSNIQVYCVLTDVVKRATQSVIYTINIVIPFYNLSQEAASGMLHSFDSLLKSVLSDFTSLDLNATIQRSCGSGQVLSSDNKCVNCGKGYYYIREHNRCELCPLGSYNDKEKQTACTPCDENETTLSLGSYSHDQCFGKCDLGYYLFDGTCEPCEIGTYQDTEGATSCKPCPFGQTTHIMMAKSRADCYVVCGIAGMEVTADGYCVPCPPGTYKEDSSEVVCQPCPYGYTTPVAGASTGDMCSLVVCRAGYWRTTENACEPCLVGTYQSLEGQTYCLGCPAGMTTSANASVDIGQCVAGHVDECVVGSHTCHTSAQCVDTEDTYQCQCPPGFTQDDSGACIDNCVGVCDMGTCEKGENGAPSCLCDEGYEGLRCQNKSTAGLGVSALVGIMVAVVFVLVAVIIVICLRRHILDKDGKTRWQFPIHRTDLRSSFRAIAMAMNPRYDMGGERRAVIRQGRMRPRWTEQEAEHGSNSGHSNTSYF